MDDDKSMDLDELERKGYFRPCYGWRPNIGSDEEEEGEEEKEVAANINTQGNVELLLYGLSDVKHFIIDLESIDGMFRPNPHVNAMVQHSPVFEDAMSYDEEEEDEDHDDLSKRAFRLAPFL